MKSKLTLLLLCFCSSVFSESYFCKSESEENFYLVKHGGLYIKTDKLKEEYDLFMNGDNSEDNKKKFYMDRMDEKLLDFINDRFDFYKRMNDNPSVKNTIFDLLYSDYRDRRNVS